nr:GAF and ANTAR domain-containing protein [Motilibacter aurantiacus]
MAGLLLTEETVATALRLVTSLAVEAIPAATGSGLTLVGPGGHPATSAATDDVVEQSDALQYDLDEGPCLAAAASRALVRVDDTGAEQRWPGWASAATRLGLRSSLSAPLVAGDRCLGALKVYGREPHAFDARTESMLVLFSAQAAILVANVQAYDSAQRLSGQLREALRSRDLIGQAKGILIATRRVDEDTAFAMLAATSQRENRKVHDVARGLVESYSRRRR